MTDLNGVPIRITDLSEAVRITHQFREYTHEGKDITDFDTRRAAYWADLHSKLTAIQAGSNNNLKGNDNGECKQQ